MVALSENDSSTVARAAAPKLSVRPRLPRKRSRLPTHSSSVSDEAEGDEGQEAVHVAADQRHVDEAQAKNEGAETDGDPERPEQGAAIALPDVVETDGDPQLAIVASPATGRASP